MIELRDYQLAGMKHVRKHWKAGLRNVLAVAPTGAGKGEMAVAFAVQASRRGERTLFIVHLRDVAEDIAERMRNAGVRVGLLMPGHPRDGTAPVQVASTQSLIGRWIGKFDLVIVDEAHHYRADEWQSVIEAAGKNARMVGFTATPERADGKGLGDVFEALVDVISYSKLRAAKQIVSCRAMVPPTRLDGDIAMEPAEAYLKYAKGTSAFCYVRSLEKANEVVETLRRARVSAAIVASDTPYEERSAAVAELKRGDLKVIVNHSTMIEGIDAPIVSTIVLEQRCLHMGTFIQRVGRALRAHKGKKQALLLDLTGAVYKHGIPGQDHVYELSDDNPMQLDGYTRHKTAVAKAVPNVLGQELILIDEHWLAKNGGPRFINWDEQPLGKEPDAVIGRRIGVSSSTVGIQRTLRGIPRFEPASQRIDWRRQPLGKRSDAELGKALRVDANVVARARERLGIEPFRVVTIALDPKWDSEPLGKVPDRELAKKHGVSIGVVGKARRARGIKAFADDFKEKVRNHPLLGSASIAELAKILGVDKATIVRARKAAGLTREPSVDRYADFEPQLGKVPDRAIAEQLGVSIKSVREARKRRGINSSFIPGGNGAVSRIINSSDAALLGTAHDGDIAARIGVSRHAVLEAREKLDIRAFSAWDNEPLFGKVPDRVIAEKHGRSLSSVREARERRGIGAFARRA